jgi:phosphoglycolate phosphatase-like HAD superfamily hydrolase
MPATRTMNLKPPRIISFDIDGTLVDFLSMLHAALDVVGQSFANTVDAATIFSLHDLVGSSP